MMVGENSKEFWGASIFILESNTALHDAHYVPLWVKVLPVVVSLFGIWLAYVLYIKNRQALVDLVAHAKGLHAFLYNKWYFDELYRAIFVKPAHALGRILWKGGDGQVIDGFGPDGVAARIADIARGASRLQSGYVYHYAFAMLIGVVLLLTWYFGSAGA